MNNNNKVCVYTICKNEENNIDKWIDSVKDADLICIIDTGSTDNTLNKLEKYYNDRKLHVYESFIREDFSFSLARNKAMDTAKKYIISDKYIGDHDLSNWVFVSLDLDEFIEANGINRIRNIWNKNTDDTIELAVICINHDENNESYIESESYVHHKVHSPLFYWVRDIHEIIKSPEKTENEWRVKHSEICYHHIQDKNKPRNYYQLLKKSFINGDRTSKTLIYLSWEAYEHNELENMYNYAKIGLDICYNDTFDENYLDYQYIICFKRYLSMYYTSIEKYNDAYKQLNDCIDIFITGKFPRTRLIYRELARIMWHIDRTKSILYYHQFNEIHCPKEYWVEDFKLYTREEVAINYMELSNAYYYSSPEKDYQKNAIIYAEKAYELFPENETIKSNLEWYKNHFISTI